MEKVQRCERLPFVSGPISLKTFLNQKAVVSGDFDNLENKNISLENKMREYLGEIPFDFTKIEETCSFEALTAARRYRIKIKRSELKIPEGVDLETLKLQKKAIENENPDQNVYFRNLLNRILFPLYEVEQEFHVIGQNFLTELRDEIGCVSDNAIPGEFSEDPDMLPEGVCLKDFYKSGFFFIDGVFYNDLRSSDAKDYSKIIIDWANESDRGIGPFKTKPMEEARFIDLTIRLGYPYVYIHQGSCEHLLVFSDVRLITKDDSLFRESYPRFTHHICKFRTFCMVCSRQGANWVVTESCRLPDTPYYFCDHCFRLFNYKKNGTKIGEFKARKIIDRSVLT